LKLGQNSNAKNNNGKMLYKKNAFAEAKAFLIFKLN
jgi:hypothetical protein